MTREQAEKRCKELNESIRQQSLIYKVPIWIFYRVVETANTGCHILPVYIESAIDEVCKMFEKNQKKVKKSRGGIVNFPDGCIDEAMKLETKYKKIPGVPLEIPPDPAYYDRFREGETVKDYRFSNEHGLTLTVSRTIAGVTHDREIRVKC